MNASCKSRFLVTTLVLLILTCATYFSNFIILLQEQGNLLRNTVPHQPMPKSQNELVRRLLASEANWKRGKERRRNASSQPHLTEGLDLSKGQIIWDSFYPSFDCPFTKERIGRVGDGGKWICGFNEVLQTKSKCVIFSFGVNDDTSFEEEILKRTTNCVVYMFDPTISSQPSIVQLYPGRAFFHPIGIYSSDAGNLKTLKSLMSDYKVGVIDVLKMDVEGAEWKTMLRILRDFPNRLPFVQLQIEVHLSSFQDEDWLRVLTDWWGRLESAGLRSFFQEPNLLNTARYEYRELAFLNIKTEPFKF